MNADRERKEQLIRNQRRMMLLKARRTSAAPSAPARVAPRIVVVQNEVNKSSYHPSVAMLQRDTTKDMVSNVSSPIETTPIETTPIETTPIETTPIETTPMETTQIKKELSHITTDENLNNMKKSIEQRIKETTADMKKSVEDIEQRIKETTADMKKSVEDIEQRIKETTAEMKKSIEQQMKVEVNNVKKRLDETKQSIEPTLQSTTNNMNKVHLQLADIRQDVGTMKQQIYSMLQTLSEEKPVTHIFFYAIANKAVPVYDDNKEEVSEYSVEIHEKVLLNYPMIKENKKIWIQIRRISENGAVRMFWVKFFSENQMNFENVSFF
jgi:hypothetical protein